jgi:glycosyltransferase involved in cell wall biosynthesis
VNSQRKKIAVFGIRSLPPSDGSGGSDTIAEALYSRLADRGYAVVVYCRKYRGASQKCPSRYKNMRLIHLPTIRRQGFDTLIHSFLCTLHIIFFSTGELIHIHNAGNIIWVPLLKLFGKKCFIGVDGLDWKRTRWPVYVRAYLRTAVYLAAHLSDRIIVDNVFAYRHYVEKLGEKIVYIPYGVEIKYTSSRRILEQLHLEPHKYILFVGRFIPEKGIHYLIEAFEKLDTDIKLVLVGDNLLDKRWVDKLRSTKDKRIVFTGYLYGQSVDELMQHCYLYVQPSDVEGLSPVILTAMSVGKCVLASDILENRFLVQENGFLFQRGDVGSLLSALRMLLSANEEVRDKGKRAQRFVAGNFSWDKVVDQYVEIFLKC